VNDEHMKTPIRLEDLYSLVEARASDGRPLARVRAAVETAKELHELGDELVDRA
jgi:hypothetical protein